MAAKKYIAINAASTNTEERDLRNDVGEFAYVDWGELDAPFDTHSLKIGSHSFVGADWTNVQHAPSVLPAGGHFQVFTADNSTIVLYTVSVASSVKNSCFLTRSARLVITDGVAENWVYFAQGTTQKFGRIKVASEYDGGMATEMKHEVYDVDFINQYAFLDRGTLTEKINFNTVTKSGRYRIENVGGWVSKGSMNCPPTEISSGDLEVTKNNCSVFQKFYPDDANRTGYFFREKSATGGWSSWFTATEGNMMIGTDKVYVPTYYRRGIASGYAQVPVYSAAAADKQFKYTQGYGISIVDNVISWVGSIGLETDPIYTGSSWYNTVNNASNWNTAYSWGNFALRNLTLQGAAGRVSVSGGTQSLGADRIWSVDLTPVHTGLSGGSATQVPGLNVDAYGRVTVLNNIPINFPVTSVNGQTGAVSLTTTNIPEGTNLYWTVARGDARYSLLGHTHTWNDVSNKPLTFTPSAHTHPYTEVTGITAGTGITYTGGVIASTITQYTNAMARAAISAGGLLSYNSTTGVMSLATVPWTSVTGAPDFSGVPLTRAITVAGTTNNIVVSGGTQTLGADRTWTVDLVPIHANPLSGGSGFQVPGLNVDRNGRVTALTNIAITYPVTSVNAQTGAVSLNTDNITEGTTNKYFSLALARSAFSAGTSISISAGGVISYTGAAGLTGSGTLNYVPKFSSASALTNSQIFDNGSGVAIGTTDPAGYRLRVNGAIYADGDVSAVAMYLGSGQAIRVPVGNMFIDSPSGVTYFRTTGYAYSMTLSGPNVLMGTITVNGSRTLQVVGGIRSTGQMQLADYTASTSYSGTAAALLGTDSGGNVITISTDRYAPLVHNHNGDYYTKSQVDGFLSGKADWGHTHTIAQVTGLQSALDGKTPWGHTHTIAEVTGLQGALDNRPTWGDVYTRTQLNTSGAGGAVHWDNVTNKPATYAPSYHRTNWSDVDGAPAFLTSFTESDPFGFDSHWFSTSGSNVTLGVQRRNGTQAFASFSVPSTSSNYSLNLSPFTSGLGHHVFNLVKSGGGGNSVDLFEQDPKGIAYVQLQKSGSNLTIIITRRDLTTATDTIAI